MINNYVIMSEYYSPVAIVLPKVHCIFKGTKKQCNDYVKNLNDKAVKNEYYGVKANIVESK